MLVIVSSSAPAAVVEMEYFIGADPGQGNGTILSVSSTANSTASDTPQVSIPNNLSPGTHNIGVRVKDSAGRWSNSLVRRVTIHPANYSYPNASPAAAQKLVAAETFIGTDPGAGQGLAVGLVEEGFVASANSTSPLSSGAAPGTYSVGLRFRDQAGRWSNPLIRRLTIRPASEVANTIAGLPAGNTIPPDPATPQTYRLELIQAISAGQLFSLTIGGAVVAIESRPFENRADFLTRLALAINSDPAASLLAQATANGSTSVLVAAKQNGLKPSGWLQASDTLVSTLVAQGTLGSEGRKIVAAEYFVGIDPNVGNGTAILLGSTGANAADFLEATVPISACRAGNHRVGLRFKNAAGEWGNPLFKGFASFSIFNPVDTVAPVITLAGNATMQVGVGSAYTDPGATAADGVDGNLSGNITVRGGVNTAVPGQYTITYYSQDTAGNSASAVRTVNVVETALPVFQGNPNIVHTVPPSTVDLFAGLIASHPKFGDLSHRVRLVSGSVDWFTPGTYNLQFEVGDPAGNTATLQRSITLGSNATFYPGFQTWIKERGDLTNAVALQRLAGADPDQDGRTNAQEWQADTDPFNRWSALESKFAPSGNAYLMKWSAMQRISYTIEESSNLASWTTMDVPMTFETDSLVETEIIPNSTDRKKFYRLKASPKQPLLDLP
jgi:hypothetical protein